MFDQFFHSGAPIMMSHSDRPEKIWGSRWTCQKWKDINVLAFYRERLNDPSWGAKFNDHHDPYSILLKNNNVSVFQMLESFTFTKLMLRGFSYNVATIVGNTITIKMQVRVLINS